MKTAVLLVALALLTGCSEDGGTGPAPVVPASAEPVGGPSAEPIGDPSAEAEDPSGNLAGVGEDGDWDAFIEECANPEQEALVQLVTTGDLTGDGTADALVARTCDVSTSYFPSTIEVFDGASPAASPTRVGAPILTDAGPTDRPWVIGMAVKDQAVTVTAYGTPGTDGNACPRLRLTYRYQLTDGAFEQVDRAAATSADCLPIA